MTLPPSRRCCRSGTASCRCRRPDAPAGMRRAPASRRSRWRSIRRCSISSTRRQIERRRRPSPHIDLAVLDQANDKKQETAMEMSVPINQTGGQAREADAKSPPRSANSSDLDAWLEKVEAMGELKRITAEVDPD